MVVATDIGSMGRRNSRRGSRTPTVSMAEPQIAQSGGRRNSRNSRRTSRSIAIAQVQNEAWQHRVDLMLGVAGRVARTGVIEEVVDPPVNPVGINVNISTGFRPQHVGSGVDRRVDM